jgi:hypothetical protein
MRLLYYLALQTYLMQVIQKHVVPAELDAYLSEASYPETRLIPGLIKMSAFDWSMTRWYKTHATGW